MKRILTFFFLSLVISIFSPFSHAIVWTVNSGIWNSTYTWSGSSIPANTDEVWIEDGYTVYIDTAAECKALRVNVQPFANIVFSPDGITGSTLTVSGNIDLWENASITMNSTNANDILNLSANTLFFEGDGGSFDSNLSGNNSKLTVSLSGDIYMGWYSVLNNGSFSITANASSDINISCAQIRMLETSMIDWDILNISINSPNVRLNFNSSGYTSLGSRSDFSINIGAGATTSSALFKTAGIDNAGNFDMKCLNISSTMTLTLDGGLSDSFIASTGKLYLVGSDPSSNPKPDSRDVRRNFTVNGEFNESYMKCTGIVDIEHVALNRLGKWRTPDKYGIYFYNFDGAAGQNLIIYNCDVSSSADTGIYMTGCTRLNEQWYNQGITSCVIRNCVYNGIWFSGITKSMIAGCQVYSNNLGGNVGYGIRLENSDVNTLKNNIIYDNKIIGLYLDNSDKNLIFNNAIHDQVQATGQEGMYLYNSVKNVIVNNQCYRNPVHGIALEYGSNYNYVAANKCFNNSVGGLRIRYNANKNIFIDNISTGNAKTGFTSHSSIDTLCSDEVYNNNGSGDVYIEGETNQGYVSQIWMRNCLLNSTTEFTNTPEKQEFTKENSWLISERHDNTNGLTEIFGQFSFPQSAQTWHTSDIFKFNYSDQLFNSNAHGWNTTQNIYDTPMLRYDDGGIDGPGMPASGTNDISSINTSSTTTTELWIVTYNAAINRWYVWSSNKGYHSNIVKPDDDYQSDNGEVRFRITHHAGGPSPSEEYDFITMAQSGDSYCQKVVKMSDFSDPSYIGARFINNIGGTIEMVGVSSAPTVVTNKHAEDKAYTPATEFYYGLNFGGTINRIAYTSFTYINANGLTLNTAPLANTTSIYIDCLQRDTTYSAYINANNITHTFDNVTLRITTGSAYGVKAKDSTLYFRDYNRPFLPDNLTNSIVYWDPTIIWTGLSGFTEDGVEPNTIDRGNSLEFQAKYTDLNNTPPTTAQVWIDLDDDLVYRTTEQIGMSLKPGVGNDGNYSNGEIYHYIIYDLPYPPVPSVGRSGGKIKYRFYASNPYSMTYATYTYDLSNVYNSVISTYEATGVGTSTNTFTIRGVPPRCTVTTPSTKQRGLVSINYNLIDDDDKPDPSNYCSILVEYRDGSSWKTATRFSGSEPIIALRATTGTGTAHTFIWNSGADLSGRDLSTSVRITPTDEDGAGSPVTTGSFWMDNLIATKLAFTSLEQNLEQGATSQVITIEAQDNNSNKDIDVYGVINVLTTSSDYNFVHSTANTKITQIIMTAGKTEFKYCDNITGFPTITVSSSGYLQSTSQNWSISSAVSASTSTISTGGVTTYVAGSTANVTITIYDSGKNPIQNKTVNIFVSGLDVGINQPLDKTNIEGKAYASFWSTKAEDKVITAAVIDNNILLVSSVAVTFIPGSVDANMSTIELSTPMAPVGSSVTVTVTLYDRYMNPTPNKTISLSVSPLRSSDIVMSTMPTNSSGITLGTLYSNASENKNISVTVQPPPSFITLTHSASVLFQSMDITPPLAISANPSDGVALSGHFDNVSVYVNDTGGSGINLTSTTLQLSFYHLMSDYSWQWDDVQGALTYLPATGGDVVTFKLSFSPMSVNGTYKIVCIPYDNANNKGLTFTSQFILNIHQDVPILRTSPLGTSGKWNDPMTWDPPQIPTSGDGVIVNQGFNLIIDTAAACVALEIELKDCASISFSSGTGSPASLALGKDITFNAGSRIEMKTDKPTGDKMSLSARDILLKLDNDSIFVGAMGDNSDLSINVRDISLSNDMNCSFNVIATTRSNNPEGAEIPGHARG